MSRFMNPRFAALRPYVPGEQPREMRYVKLNTNESPYPPAPAVLAAVSAAEVRRLNLYPDPDCRLLREKLAARYGVGPENVLVANGSDEVLNFTFMAFCDAESGVACPDISYGFYPVLAALYGVPLREVPLAEDFSLRPEDYFGLGCPVVFANPNAPTGRAIRPAQVERILQNDPDHVVLVDEAYADFGAESCVPLVSKYDNLLVSMTFSKSRSMAGGRLGFAIGSAGLIGDLEKIRCSTNPYNINRLTMAAALATLDSDDYYMENCRRIAQTRDRTAEQLAKRGFSTLPSLTNFLFTACPEMSGEQLYQKLRARGVLVRYWNTPRLKDHIRVTIGSPEEMETFLAAVDASREER